MSAHPDSPWTHALCALCFSLIETGRDPYRMKGALTETCCNCGERTSDGIFYRADPKDMPECSERPTP